MANANAVTLYSQAIPGLAPARNLVCVGTLVGDAVGASERNSIIVDYYVELTPGQAASRVAITREDFLAVRAIKAMP